MADWKNQLSNIINKIKQQLHAKKIDNLETVQQWIAQFDTDGSGVLEKYEFEKFLGKIGIFLSTQEFRCVYNTYDANRDGRISYNEFIQMIRTSMSQKRLAVVKHAFQFLDQSGSGSIPLQQLFQAYQGQEHPRVKSKQKNVEQVSLEFQASISKKSSDGVNITEPEFLDYYADVNSTLPNEKEEYFIDLLLKTWAITSAEDYVSPERLADLEVIVYEKIRQKTFTSEDEGKTVYKAFKYFDLMDIGIIDIQQFKSALAKFGCIFSDKEIQALFNKYDKDRSGKICFDEFCGLFASMGAGDNPNVKPVFALERVPPRETLVNIQKILQTKPNGVDFLAECFRKSDVNQNGTLNRDEFKWALKEVGIQLTQTELTNIFKFLDKHNSNAINFESFLGLL